MSRILSILLLAGSLFACNQAKKDTQSAGDNTVVAVDTMKMQFNTTGIDTMTVIFTGSDKKSLINEADKAELGKLLSQSVNDTLWNNSGIMVKMVAPDYTVISHYKGKEADNNSWLMIWKENGRAKFENKWYFLAEDKKNEIYQLIDKYK
ncbi:hypothetical protein D0T84_13925 [Dysgonomonas sp. 521]|nr:hypothetical protein [Dysgonomonas sp. 521]